MPALTTAPSKKRKTLSIRIKPEALALIDRAAKTQGKSRIDFILDAARSAAEEALLNQVLIARSPTAHAEFVRRLDMPPQPNERLRKTMHTPTLLEPIANDWAWLDALAGPVDVDFQRATEERPAPPAT